MRLVCQCATLKHPATPPRQLGWRIGTLVTAPWDDIATVASGSTTATDRCELLTCPKATPRNERRYTWTNKNKKTSGSSSFCSVYLCQLSGNVDCDDLPRLGEQHSRASSLVPKSQQQRSLPILGNAIDRRCIWGTTQFHLHKALVVYHQISL